MIDFGFDKIARYPDAPAVPKGRPAPRRPNVLPPGSRMPGEGIIEGPDDDEENDSPPVSPVPRSNWIAACKPPSIKVGSR